MDLFKIILKRIFYKVPIKLLLVVIIGLLCIIVLNTKSFGAEISPEPNFSDVSNKVTNNQWVIFYSPTNDKYYLAWSYLSSTPLNAHNLINTDGVYTFDGRLCASSSYTPLSSQFKYKFFIFNTNNNTFVEQGYTINYDTSFGANCKLLYSGSTCYGFSSNRTGVNFNTNGYTYHPFVSPFVEDTSHIATWDFDYLTINTGSETPYYDGDYYKTINLEITNHSTGIVYTIDCWGFLENFDNEYAIINIPRYELTRFNVYNGLYITLDLFIEPSDSPNSFDR